MGSGLLLVKHFIIPGKPHLACALRSIHRDIRPAHQFACIEIIEADRCQSDACPHQYRPFVDTERAGKLVEHSAGNVLQCDHSRRPRHHNGEFITPEPRDHSACPDLLLQQFCNAFDQAIAHLMPIIVIDSLEPIKVDQCECQLFSPFQPVIQVAAQGATIRQAAQAVHQGLFGQRGNRSHGAATDKNADQQMKRRADRDPGKGTFKGFHAGLRWFPIQAGDRLRGSIADGEPGIVRGAV